MKYSSYQEMLCLSDYYNSTGDAVSIRILAKYKLLANKSHFSRIRKMYRKSDFSSPICSPFENLPTKDEKGMREQPVKILISRHFSKVFTPTDFTSSDIKTLATIPRSTISKAIRELIRDGRIEILDSDRRPKVYRWNPEEQPDPVDIFMKVYSIDSVQASFQFSLAHLPCHLNRSLCGLPYLGDNLTIRITERMDIPIMNNDKIACFEAGLSRMLPYVISSRGDFRIFKRRIDEEIALTKKIRNLIARITVDDRRRESLEMRCLSDSFISLIESEQGKRGLYVACRKVCGDEIHREEVNDLLPQIANDICKEFPSLSYDESTSSLESMSPSDKSVIENALTKTMRMYAQKSDKPVKKVNIKSIYQEAERELKRQTKMRV
jgi:hypothetical protein